MKLEEAIHQKKFAHPWQKAILNIMYTNNWMLSQIKTLLKEHDVTPQQYNVLRILRGQYPNPITTSVIRERMLDKMSDASRIVDRLHKKGWVASIVCTNDKRLVDVIITDEGLKLLEAIGLNNDTLEMVTSNLTEQEAITLNELLDKIRTQE